MKSSIPRVLMLMVCLLTVGCDQVSKSLATELLRSGTVVELIPGLFELRYTQNHDVAFSILEGFQHDAKPLLLTAAALLAVACIGWLWWRRRTARGLEQLGYALAVGGAVGNIVDRLGNGYVVDFLHLSFWPVFNVADVAIVVGIGMVVLARPTPASPRDPRHGGPG
jgi:signal peptidase II